MKIWQTEYQRLNIKDRYCAVAVFQSSQARVANTSNSWNCSVPHWPRFRRHFRCNMRQECANEEDEIQCPYSYCRHGGVRLDGLCFFYVVKDEGISWLEAQRECRLMGANLASLSSFRKWERGYDLVALELAMATWRSVHVCWFDVRATRPAWHVGWYLVGQEGQFVDSALSHFSLLPGDIGCTQWLLLSLFSVDIQM